MISNNIPSPPCEKGCSSDLAKIGVVLRGAGIYDEANYTHIGNTPPPLGTPWREEDIFVVNAFFY